MMGFMGGGWSKAVWYTVLLPGLMAWPASASGQNASPELQPEAQRPQEPKAPLPYAQEDVSFANPNAAGVEIAGTLTKPATGGPFPAVLLITGAGPQDRDETMFGHKPFLVWADYLTRRGLAVLRVDDRGTGHSTGQYGAATIQDFASDAEAAVRFLKTRKDVNPMQIGLIGHGEGAIVATITAARMTGLAFVVLLGGTAVSGENVLLVQTLRAEEAANASEDQINADWRIGAYLYRMAALGRSDMELREILLDMPQAYAPYVEAWKHRLKGFQSPWLRFFLRYDPSSDLEKLQCPVLAVFGEKDLQEDPEQNASAMKKAFSEGRNHQAKIKVLPGLNYMLQGADTGLVSEYSSIAETVSPVALKTVGNWIQGQVRLKPR